MIDSMDITAIVDTLAVINNTLVEISDAISIMSISLCITLLGVVIMLITSRK